MPGLEVLRQLQSLQFGLSFSSPAHLHRATKASLRPILWVAKENRD